jgi:hypothetical protein
MRPQEPEYAHEHDHEHDEPPRTAEAARAPERGDVAHLFRAAASGRPDVLGTGGLSSLQRAVGNSAVGAMFDREAGPGAEETEAGQAGAQEERSPVHDVLATSGSPLDTDTRSDMERRMGTDFSDVRVHTDSAAHESARAVGAHAYTVGNHVVFQRDSYDPASTGGRTTLAHELTHVVQQRSGPVDGTEAPGGIRVSDPSDRFEREAAANADRVLSEPAPPPAPEPSGPAPEPASAAVQREAAPTDSVQRDAVQREESQEGEDEEPADVQGSFVQREPEEAAKEGKDEEKEAEEEEGRAP